MAKDWRTIFVYPWWLIAAILFLGFCALTFWGAKVWIVDPYILNLIQGG